MIKLRSFIFWAIALLKYGKVIEIKQSKYLIKVNFLLYDVYKKSVSYKKCMSEGK